MMRQAMSEPASILIDWGTTNFRAWLVAADGKIMDRREAPGGIMQVPAGGFPRALEAHVGKWREAYPDLPVVKGSAIACGMITRREYGISRLTFEL
jgi:2-dehydro-3-deoxygalactonokinase